nr:PH domain-containing protein [Brevibacillus marinus]
MVFRSKVDKFFVAVISISVLLILAVCLIPLFFDHGRTTTDTIIVLSLCMLSIGFVLWPAFSIQYVFYPDHLLVKGGPFRSKIPYETITKVSPTREIFTGYRLLSAKDGLEIFYTSALFGSVKISPQDSELFIAELKKRCPNMQIDRELI